MITKGSLHNFSVAFEQMCSIVAIGKTKSHEDTLSELIIQCLAVFPEEQFQDVKEIQAVINSIFGLDLVEHEIGDALAKLIQQGVISDSPFYKLNNSVCAVVESKIQEAKQLEEKIRNSWRDELKERYPLIAFNEAWQSLQRYLAYAFQRHGMQAISLLNPVVEIPEEYTNSLSSILSSVVNENFQDGQRNNARKAISDFMATTGNTPERAKYISQLADGAFNYFNLTISPEVATNFKAELNSLSIFLDTNFLFGILGIDVGPQVAVSNELISVIKDYQLPFKLFVHEATIKELLISIDSKERELKSKNWSKSISRAASQSRYLSGVELMYHQRYSETGIDVESFFAPYKHADVLIKKKGIAVFPDDESDRHEVHLLIADYQDFIDDLEKSKIYELIDHDMTVLHRVKALRSESNSTLDARAIFMTCDFTLYRFDSNYCKKQGTLVSTVLPNVFWQIIRPYIPSNEIFDKAFAETFAIPEFRTIGSSAAKACSKMLHILAGFKDFPEETATKMLSNDLLIQQLESAETDQEFQNYVDAEIVRENEALLSKNKELLAHINNKDSIIQDNERKLEMSQVKVNKLSSVLQGKEEIISEIEAEFHDAATKLGDIKKENDRLENILHIIIFVVAGLFAIGITEAVIHLLPIKFVLGFGRPILLQVIINILVVTFLFGLLDKKRRKWWWGGSILSFITNVLTIFINLPFTD